MDGSRPSMKNKRRWIVCSLTRLQTGVEAA